MAEIGSREPLTKEHIDMIARNLGMGAIILDLGQTDYSRGSMVTKDGRCFWLKDGRRVELSVSRGGIFASITKDPDPDIPDVLEENNLKKEI